MAGRLRTVIREKSGLRCYLIKAGRKGLKAAPPKGNFMTTCKPEHKKTETRPPPIPRVQRQGWCLASLSEDLVSFHLAVMHTSYLEIRRDTVYMPRIPLLACGSSTCKDYGYNLVGHQHILPSS